MKSQFALVLALLATVNVSALAGPASTSDTVLVGGTVIMRVRVAAAGYSVEQRTTALQERVNDLLGRGPIHASDITVEPFGSEAVVKVKGQLLFTADWTTARFNHTTPNALANQWAENMRGILPKLTEPK